MEKSSVCVCVCPCSRVTPSARGVWSFDLRLNSILTFARPLPCCVWVCVRRSFRQQYTLPGGDTQALHTVHQFRWIGHRKERGNVLSLIISSEEFIYSDLFLFLLFLNQTLFALFSIYSLRLKSEEKLRLEWMNVRLSDINPLSLTVRCGGGASLGRGSCDRLEAHRGHRETRWEMNHQRHVGRGGKG